MEWWMDKQRDGKTEGLIDHGQIEKQSDGKIVRWEHRWVGMDTDIQKIVEGIDIWTHRQTKQMTDR